MSITGSKVPFGSRRTRNLRQNTCPNKDGARELAARADILGAWNVPSGWHRVLAVDAHTAGEPLRVVLDGFPERSRGADVLAWRREARTRHDGLRRALMWEPRGHADMYGCVVGAPVSPGADVSVLFTHNEGYSTMCGHGVIGVVTVLLECGVLQAGEPETAVTLDTPAGLVHARAAVAGGRVRDVSFENVPSFALALDASVDVPGVGHVRYDMAYGGAFYAYVSAADFGLELVPAEIGRLIELGRRIKAAVQAHAPPEHPDAEDLGFAYGTIFVGPAHGTGAHSRNVCVFADGEVDRSPTGTGVSGRLAIEHARGALPIGVALEIESILGTRFRGRVLSEAAVGPHAAIVPEVSGRAFITGRNELLIDPEDPLAEGFLLR
jgi:trans-L-3-hydroxyproline dehydratase